MFTKELQKYRIAKYFTRNIQDMFASFLHPSDLLLFTDKDISLIFIHVIYCWYVAYMWIRIPYSAIRQVNVLIVPLLMRCCSTDIRSISRLIVQDSTLAIVKLDSIVQQGTFELTFYQKKRGRAFRNKSVTIRSFFVLKFPINYIIRTSWIVANNLVISNLSYILTRITKIFYHMRGINS